MKTQVDKWGDGLAVRIPGIVARELDLAVGVELEVTAENGGLVLRRSRHEYTLEELLARITPENVHGETDWGNAVGREAW